MPEATRNTLELAKRFRDAAADECAMPYYSEMMLRAADDLEAFAATKQTRLALPSAA